MIIVQDVNDLAAEHPDLVATIRREANMFGRSPATTLERLCCDAKICRVLTDGPSEILDVGRLTRSVPPAIWNTLVARDRHCTAPGCDRSPEYCEAHHIWYWEFGGPHQPRQPPLVVLVPPQTNSTSMTTSNENESARTSARDVELPCGSCSC